MALVRVSKELLDQVSSTISSVGTKTYATTVKPLDPMGHPEIIDAMFEAGMAVVWKGHEQFRDSLPKKWYVEAGRMDVTVGGSREEYKIARKVKCPPGTPEYGYIDANIPASSLPPNFGEIVKAHQAAVKAHKEKFDKVQSQVKDYLLSCKSLNDALKKFPDLALYVPQSYLDKVATKVSRNAALEKEEAEAPEIDRDLIVATGVVGKLQE